MGFVPFTFVDLIDIILVAVIMYWIYRMTKGTNAPYILSGIIAVYLLWVVVRALNMELLSTILGQLISVGAIALIIVFQPELRRFLQMIGMRQKHFNFITRIFSTGEDTVQTNVVPIVTACREMSEGRLTAHVVVDALQGGAGTSTNMNVNEVLANRALELLGGVRGEYSRVSPLDDINRHQSTNDTYPTALRVAEAAYRAEKRQRALEDLVKELMTAERVRLHPERVQFDARSNQERNR